MKTRGFVDSEFLVIVCLFALLIGLFVFYAIASKEDRERWAEFKAAHNCKLVARQDSTTSWGVGVSSSGNTSMVPVSNPALNSYLCDDGITYVKEY